MKNSKNEPAPAWLEVSLEVLQTAADEASEALTNAGALAVTLQSGNSDEVLEPAVGEMPLWPHLRLTGLFAADADPRAIESALLVQGVVQDPGQLQFSGLADQQWERSWMDRFQPMQFGQRLWIYPSNTVPPPNDDVVLRLDPGLAFGTGTHPTTALCLAWLDGANLDGARVVDYGCGSGILAIAAALLGARQVVAVDNDPQALQASLENATRNGVAEKISVLAPADFRVSDADLVVANILSRPLIELAPVLAACLAGGGRMVLSGILENQAEAVQAAYRESIEWHELATEQGWVRLAGSRYGD